VAVHLGLHTRQDFFPDIAGNHWRSLRFRLMPRRPIAFGIVEERQEWPQIVLGGLSPVQRVRNYGVFLIRYAEEHEFPQVFAQVWKTLGGDQIPYASLESVARLGADRRM
jgi:hypothetical protein